MYDKKDLCLFQQPKHDTSVVLDPVLDWLDHEISCKEHKNDVPLSCSNWKQNQIIYLI